MNFRFKIKSIKNNNNEMMFFFKEKATSLNSVFYCNNNSLKLSDYLARLR